MRLTLLIVAINAEKELGRILPELCDIGDELVIGVDDTTTDATAEVARQFTGKIYAVPHEGFRGQGRPEDLNAIECVLPYCGGDWVLRVDQDETLSALWHDRAYVSSLLGNRTATQYWIPRRMVAPPGDRYICNGRFHPDFQLRLYRNIPSLIEFNRRPHDPPRVAGEARYLSDAWIMHWDLIWYDRAQRDRKDAFYGELGYTKDVYFIHDNEQVIETRPLDFSYPSPSAGLPRGSEPASPFCATIEILDAFEVMPAGTRQPVLVGITNRSNRQWRPSSVFVRPADVFASYHWFKAGDGHEIHRWDGERHEIPAALAPGESASCFVTVTGPDVPGDYLLQPDLVQEDVAWFSSYCPMPIWPVRIVSVESLRP